MSRLFALAFISFALLGCSPTSTNDVQRISGPTMGTVYNVAVVAPESTDLQPLQQRIDQRLAEINRVMSTYDPSSELSLLNQRTDVSESVVISADLADVIQMSLDVYRDSDGAFDATIGPLVNRWGFGPQERQQVPSEVEIAAIKAQIGMDKVQLDGDRLTTSHPLYIDLSAVAKGWAVDEIAELVQQQGFAQFLVEIGGEIRAEGRKPDGSAWRIAIERPDMGLEREPQLVIELQGKGLATSGDYRNYYEVDGQRVSHTIDPVSGFPITHNLASVSVVHDSTGLADAWATALSVVGHERAMALAKQYNLAVYMIVRSGDGYAEQQSAAFKSWLEAQTSGSR
ncbi:thiamin biosynthesis protein ApbE [Bacterioplanes sanyensis]|uniref:FAD:protein FMN transferase n=1 Tax=Bacterioplanes sanyensis TaxID=1249553 RepID=A0A222FMD8_9GAMM|nr:FAD:protein FMN transferase [Bacterioplanes sanyensis]ASP39756.1 thiamin biosynthesis protein ApbE [Bacterioplanes sanyensis]